MILQLVGSYGYSCVDSHVVPIDVSEVQVFFVVVACSYWEWTYCYTSYGFAIRLCNSLKFLFLVLCVHLWFHYSRVLLFLYLCLCTLSWKNISENAKWQKKINKARQLNLKNQLNLQTNLTWKISLITIWQINLTVLRYKG